LFLGSEGALGIVVRAWVRVQERPRFRASATFGFDDFYGAAEAARLLAQSGLHPSNCRVLDEREALVNRVGDGASSFLLVAFESADHPLDGWIARARDIARGAGGKEVAKATERDDASDRWKKMFLRGPYLRDALVELGAIVETFETAIDWRRFPDFHREVRQAALTAIHEICGQGQGTVTSRITHVYPDGAAPYFTVIAPAKKNSHLEQWDAIKSAVSETIHRAGGTITHHHAVGRDHRPWYDRERPDLFGKTLSAAKQTLDPAGIMNPGCLVTSPPTPLPAGRGGGAQTVTPLLRR
jgi:alkyldihydroxyacetonephosphate synthase